VKIAITGKGGVGKSTLTVLLARALRDRGTKVLVVDADPDMNLATLFQIPEGRTITPIVEMKELIAERTGTRVGEPAPFFTMNPKVDDIPETFWIDHQGIRLLVMGTVQRGGGGCACPENAFLRSLLGHLVVNRKDWVILDMEAGIEHLGRGTAIGVDAMLVVVEPNRTSIETAFRIQKLARDIGIKKVRLVGNKVQSPAQEEFIRSSTRGLEVLGFLGQSDQIWKVSTGEISFLEVSGEPLQQAGRVLEALG
jgi:CO dehydrogenase maturation factor